MMQLTMKQSSHTEHKQQVRNLIVGCGLSGATLAHKIATELGEEVLIIDAKKHLAGSCYDSWDENGICIHHYGAHIFHTNNKEVWRYLSRFTAWKPYMHTVKGCINGQEVPLPFNLNSIRQCFPDTLARRLEDKLLATYGLNAKVPILQLRENGDKDLAFLADYVYEKVFLHYTLKQWGMKPEDIDPSITARVPVCVSRDDRYFRDRYQGIPEQGYTAMVQNMLNHPLIRVQLGTSYAELCQTLSCERLFYTGQIDEFFGYCLGELPYRSLRFEFREYEQPYFQSGSVINYPNNYDFTRICEPKHFLDKGAPRTVIALEYPQAHEAGKTEPYYPVQSAASAARYTRYLDLAEKLNKEVYFLGRLGDYRYYNMDEAVARALEVFDTLTRPRVSILVPIFRVEAYLRQCVDSILAQTLRDIEIILIDDGSDDACPQICDEYAARDPRVRVIHKSNSGYGASMNQGLKIARGQYIGIVESDDWIEPEMFNDLYRLAVRNNAQVVRSNFLKYTDKDGDEFTPVLPEQDCKRLITPRERPDIFYCMPTIWASIYERKFLTEAGISFLESPGASYQDLGFNFKVWAMAERVWLTPKAYYHYRCDHMASSVQSQGKVFCVVDEWQEIERYLDRYPRRKEASYVVRNHVKLSNYLWNFNRLQGAAKKEFQKVFSREYKQILRNKGLVKDWYSAKDWHRLMKIIYYRPLHHAPRRLYFAMSRLFVKSKAKGDMRHFSILFGLVRIERRIRYPQWGKEERKG